MEHETPHPTTRARNKRRRRWPYRLHQEKRKNRRLRRRTANETGDFSTSPPTLTILAGHTLLAGIDRHPTCRLQSRRQLPLTMHVGNQPVAITFIRARPPPPRNDQKSNAHRPNNATTRMTHPRNKLSFRSGKLPGPRVCKVQKPHPVFIYPPSLHTYLERARALNSRKDR